MLENQVLLLITLRKIKNKTNAEESGFKQADSVEMKTTESQVFFFSVRKINQEKSLQDTTDQDAVYKCKVSKKISVRKTNVNVCGPVIRRLNCPVQFIANLQRKRHNSSEPTMLLV